MLEIALRNNFSYQKSSLRDISVEINIGIHDWERQENVQQKVLIDVDMFRFQGKFTGNTIRDCIDYDIVFNYITQQWPRRAQTDLLETLIEELIDFCFQNLQIDACRISIKKPAVFGGRAVPGVEFFRTKKVSDKKTSIWNFFQAQ